MKLPIYVGCASILFIVVIKVAFWFRRLIRDVRLINKIPGPAGVPILGNMKDVLCSSDQLWLNLRRFSSEYPIYKLWACHVPLILITKPEDAEVLIGSSKNIEKSEMYLTMQGWLGNGLLTSTGSKWQKRRKMLTPTFHFNILNQFLSIFSEQSSLLVQSLEDECDKSYTDIVPHISKFTLNTICETAMGVNPDLLEKNEKSYRDAIHQMGTYIVYRILRPWFFSTLTFCFTSIFWKQRKLEKFLHAVSLNVIKERKAYTENELQEKAVSKKRLAMLDLLITEQKTGTRISDDDIREEVDTFMFEGHDTTSVGICFTLMLLACHQDVQDKVREEISQLEPSDDKFSYNNLQQLNYLEMVIKESLRLYPSVPLIARLVSEDITTPSGYLIPKDYNFTVLIYDIHRNPVNFPNPDKFDPERFTPENSKNRHPFAYIPFSAGPRNCIGQKFAMLELKMVVAKVVENFRLHPVDTSDSIILTIDLLLRTQKGIKIKFERI